MAASDACATCRFWDVYDEEGGLHPGMKGDCRRHPPRINEPMMARMLPGGLCVNWLEEIENTIYEASPFPVTHVTSWCGEHQPKGDGGW